MSICAPGNSTRLDRVLDAVDRVDVDRVDTVDHHRVDVVDESKKRRGNLSANEIWGCAIDDQNRPASVWRVASLAQEILDRADFSTMCFSMFWTFLGLEFCALVGNLTALQQNFAKGTFR